jgi:putative membrane-bound dehydrogenase-like protein
MSKHRYHPAGIVFVLFALTAGGADFEVAAGLEVTPFASESDLFNPASIDVDDRGRVWVMEAVNYRKKSREAGDRILILEDTDGDGKTDKQQVFYQNPDIDGGHGVCVLGNQVIVSAPDRILLLTDSNHDDKADHKKLLFKGKVLRGVQGQHDHAIHAVMFGPDGRLYFNFGNYNAELRREDGALVTDVFGQPVNNSRKPYTEGMVIRCETDGSRVEVLGHNFRNNWEVTVDSYGTMWQSDNDNGSSSCRVNYVMEYGNFGYTDAVTGLGYQSKRTNMEATMQRQMWHQNDPGVVPNLLITGSGAPTGILVYEGTLLPKPFHGQMIHAEPGRNTVWSFLVKPDGAGYTASIENLLKSTVDKNYRPSDISVAPDGSLIIADWYDPVDCCHRTVNDAGRIFRLAPPGLGYTVPTFDFTTPQGAVKALRNPNLSVRYQAWTALNGMQAKALPEVTRMARDANPRLRARALWLMAAVDGQLQPTIDLALKDEQDDIRALALRIARRHQLPVIPLIRQLLSDLSALVRRECAVSLHRQTTPEAAVLWAALAVQHDGKDRWYLEALGIGEKDNESACFAAWLTTVGDDWNTPAGRDIIWRSRAPEAAAYLARLLLDKEQAADHKRLMRALDFHQEEARTAAVATLFSAGKDAPPWVFLEAFQRLDEAYLDTHPNELEQVQTAILSTKGTVVFVDLVARFNRKDLSPQLMDMVIATPQAEAGIRATRQLFAFEEGARLLPALKNGPNRKAICTALGFADTAASTAMLRGVVVDTSEPQANRVLAINAMGKSNLAGKALMSLVRLTALPDDLLGPALRSLTWSPNEGIRRFAVAEQEKRRAATNQGQWSIDRLMAITGNARKGRLAFAKAACSACHVIDGKGIDFGPELSAIGSKLSREQLFAAILQPNQTITLGFEGVVVELKDGTSYAGYFSGENTRTLSLRMMGGLQQDIEIGAIKSRKPMAASLMPPGLADLVANLAQLGNQDQALGELLAASIHGSPSVGIAVPNGTYTLQLLLYEGWRSRSADIVIEGQTVRKRYDMLKEQGGSFHYGSVLRHTFTLTDSNVDIELKAHKPNIHLGGLILTKGHGPPAVSTIVKSTADLDLKNVIKAINFGDTRIVTIGDVSFTAAAANTTVDGVTNKAAGDVFAGEFSQKWPQMGRAVPKSK